MKGLLIFIILFISKNCIAQSKIQFDSTSIHVGTITNYQANHDSVVFHFRNTTRDTIWFFNNTTIWYDIWNATMQGKVKEKQYVLPKKHAKIIAYLKMGSRTFFSKSAKYPFFDKAGKVIEEVLLNVSGSIVPDTTK